MTNLIKSSVLALFSILFFHSCVQNNTTIKKENLLGNWALSEEENVEFIITKNKFKDFEHLYDYDYILDKNKLIVKDSTFTVARYIIEKASRDSLFLKTEKGDLLKYYNRGTVKDR